jgi:hypothetical protein
LGRSFLRALAPCAVRVPPHAAHEMFVPICFPFVTLRSVGGDIAFAHDAADLCSFSLHKIGELR